MPVNILILEDYQNDFRNITEAIKQAFGNEVNVLPVEEEDNAHNQMEWQAYFLEEKVQVKKFTDIINYYKDIDLFIIDLNLKGDYDSTGKEFYEALKDCNYRDGNFKAIEISSGPSEIKGYNTHFISKSYFFQAKIVEYIRAKFSVGKSNTNTTAISNVQTSPGRPQSDSWRNRTTNSLVAGYEAGEQIDRFVRQIIHVCITAAFYSLLLFSAWFSYSKISDCFREIMNDTDTILAPAKETAAPVVVQLYQSFPVKDNILATDTLHSSRSEFVADTIKQYHEFTGRNTAITSVTDIADKRAEMKIFKPAEDIFLYLLPMFIIFGFYNYYKTNTSIYLLGGNSARINEEKSTKSMNLTKMIFMSSIISYVLIKCTEEVFCADCNNPYRLISAGIMLIILMTYFVMMYRHHD